MLRLCLTLLVLLWAAVTTPSFGVTIFQESFEDDSSVWGDLRLGTPDIGSSFAAVQNDASDIALSGHAYTGAASILIQRTYADTHASALQCNIFPADTELISQMQTVTIEFAFYKVKSYDIEAYATIQVFDDSTELLKIRFQDDGRVDRFEGGAYTDTGLDYLTDQFIPVRVDIDTKAQTFTLAVDGVTTPGATDIPLLDTAPTVDSVSFAAGPNAQFRIDALQAEVPDSVTFFWDGFDDVPSVWSELNIGTPDSGQSFTAVQDDGSDLAISTNTRSGIGALLIQRFNADPTNSNLICHLHQNDIDLVETVQTTVVQVAMFKIHANDSRAVAFVQAHYGAERLFTVSFEDDGDISFYDGSAYVDTGLDYALGQYVDVTLTLDLAADTVTVGIGGSSTTGSTDIPFLVAAATLDSITLGVGKNGQCRFDELALSTGPDSDRSMILAFTGRDLPTLKLRTQTTELAPIWQDILAQANAYCDPFSADYANPDNVINLEFEEQWIKARSGSYGAELTRWMEAIGFAYQITGGRNYADHGAQLLVAMAEEFPITHTYMQQGFEAGVGNMMRGMALGYDWLADRMSQNQKDVFLPIVADYVQWTVDELDTTTWWKPYHNYMGVVAGAGGCLALTMRDDHPSVPTWLAALTDDLNTWFNLAFDMQGSYCEGIGYLQYGMSNAALFADGLQRYNGQDLMTHPSLQNLTHFLAMEKLPGSYMFDARNDARYEQGLVEPFVLKFANDHNDGLGTWLWQESSKKSTFLDIAWASDVMPTTPTEAGEPLAEHFTGRGLCVWRTGWDAEDVMFSLEAGPYYDMTTSSLTHDQADEGHFNLYGLGYRWANDAGYGNSTAVDSACQTVAHNCILVDRATASPDQIGQAISGGGRGTSGTILDYRDNSAYGYALADATDAYLTNDVGAPGAVVHHSRRHTVFMRDRYSASPYAVVLDDIRKDSTDHTYTWQLLSDPDVDILIDDVHDNKAILEPIAYYIDTIDDAAGTGEATWQVTISTPGDYHLWGRARALGEQQSGSDSFYVQMDNAQTVDWHFTYDKADPEKWRWFRITDGAEKNQVIYPLDAGVHTIRITTREPGAQLSRMVLTNDAQAEPLFRPFDDNEFLLDAPDAHITTPMTLNGAQTARMSLWLDASADIIYSLAHRYGRSSLADYTPQLRADVDATNPQFIAVMVPQPIGRTEPHVTFSDVGANRHVAITWPTHTDIIDWARAGDDMDAAIIAPGRPDLLSDLNYDGVVNMLDVAILTAQFNAGSADLIDLMLMAQEWLEDSRLH